ncbi:MAG: glycerophosphodiester phosphodiesterase [Mogibacterium sp.]|nr:glycerophosphodiester phosphodiesterase [Mogibacterium sp.]
MEKKSNKSSAIVITIAVMLLLCIAAALYIVKISKAKAAPEPAEEVVIEPEQPAEETPPAEDVKAKLAHIYTNSGSSSEERYTMAAFDSAVEGGSVCLSMPVVAAKDGTLYVAYDDYLRDMTGLDGYLSGMSDGQIAEVKTKGGNGIVKLSDVFEKYGTDVNYVIEIRYANERNIMPFVETVKKAGVADVTSVSSYYFGALDIVENEFPDMPKIFLSENEVDLAEAQRSDTVDLISVNRELMTAENLAAVHESGKKFGAWTLNSDEDIKSAVSMGLDSYFTDEGALAVSIEKGE